MEKHFNSFKDKNEEHFKNVDNGEEIKKGLNRYQINYLSSGLDGDNMTIYPYSRQLNIEHDLKKPKDREIKKNELFFFVIVKNVHLQCSNCFIIDSDDKISKAEDLPDDPNCKGFKKITSKSILIGNELLHIKNIRKQNHFIYLLTEAKCFCYIPDDDQRENFDYKLTNIWNIPINKGIGFCLFTKLIFY